MITPQQLKRLIDYTPDTGEMRWKYRGKWVVDEGLQSERTRKIFNKKNAGQRCLNGSDKDGYFIGQIFARPYRAHRVAMAIVNGEWPEETVDHKNRDRRDNRICNLRLASRSDQQRNRGVQVNNTSGVPGVHFSNSVGKWMARASINGKRVFLGYFDSVQEAAEAKRNYAKWIER